MNFLSLWLWRFADVRKEAVMSLVKYMAPSCAKSSCSPFGAVDEIKRYVGMCLFGKDLDTRTLLAYHLFDAQDLDKEIPQEYLEHYLQWVYRKHSLEMNGYTVNDTHSRHFTRGGCFRGVPAVVKTLKLKVREISQPGTVTSSKAQRDLINEAYCLNKLNAKPHPNILRVLAFNTAKPPYPRDHWVHVKRHRRRLSTKLLVRKRFIAVPVHSDQNLPRCGGSSKVSQQTPFGSQRSDSG